jgi:hypothetical protein
MDPLLQRRGKFQIAGSVDSPQTWKVAVNILTMQSRIADKGQSPNCLEGREANDLRHEAESFVQKRYIGP